MIISTKKNILDHPLYIDYEHHAMLGVPGTLALYFDYKLNQSLYYPLYTDYKFNQSLYYPLYIDYKLSQSLYYPLYIDYKYDTSLRLPIVYHHAHRFSQFIHIIILLYPAFVQVEKQITELSF